MIKLGLCSYSYNKYMRYIDDPVHGKKQTEGNMGLEDVFKRAYELELDGVEPTSYYFESLEPEYLRNLKYVALGYGLDIPAVGLGNNFCLPSEKERAAQIELVKKWVGVAEYLGAQCIRVFAGKTPEGHTDDQAFEWTTTSLRECVDSAERAGVVLALENHGGITADAKAIKRVLDGVGSKWVRHVLDVANYDYRKMYVDSRESAPLAVYVHARQEQITREIGEITIDYQQVKEILKGVGYNGYVSIEYSKPGDPAPVVPVTAALLKRVFAG